MIKHLGSLTIILIVTLILLEIVSTLVFTPLTGETFNEPKIQIKYQNILTEIDEKINHNGGDNTTFMLHPYLGYVHNALLPDVNSYGMLSNRLLPTPYKKSKDKFVIAVIGGSVALHFAKEAEEKGFLENALHKIKPSIANKEVIILSFPVGGFKQPQHLFSLIHALLMGFEFDLVINIDGYNDLVIAINNYTKGANPTFPSITTSMVGQLAKGIDYDLAKSLNKVHDLYKSGENITRLMMQPVFKKSRFMNLFTHLKIESLKGKLNNLQYDIIQKSQHTASLEFRGPPFDKSQDKYKMAVRIWKEASIQTHAITQLYGIKYLQILQPNQYVEGSKELSAHEKNVAYKPNSPWAKIVTKGYNLFRQEGKKLKQVKNNNKNLLFKDMTMIFKDNKEDLYFDDCCHFNLKGNEILAQEVAQIIISEELYPKNLEQ